MIDSKRDKEFYSLLANLTVSSMNEKNMEWDSAILNIEIQPGAVGMNGHYFSKNEKIWLEPRGSYDITKKIIAFHKEVTTDGTSKWNKMIFKLWKDNKIESDFIWDTVKQEQIDKYNKEEEDLNPNYKRPLWPWEENK